MTGPWVVLAVAWAIRPPRNPAPRADHSPASTVVWSAILAVVILAERYGLAHPGSGWTICEKIRGAFETKTVAGAWTFRLAWGVLACWFPGHIVAWRRRS
jgi:hypothetical protein